MSSRIIELHDKERSLTSGIPQHVTRYLAGLDFSLDTKASAPEIPSLLNKTVLDGGKRFRPVLCLLMGDVFGFPPEQMAPFARVAELLHSATLAHDDVIDDSHMRRKRATLNAMSSNSRAGAGRRFPSRASHR